MPEKQKHKRGTSDRFKLLSLAIILLGLLIGLTSITIYLLRPHGPNIVYLSPDKHGVEALWLADLANPEYPQQLTEYPPNFFISNLQITDDGHYLVYSLWGMGSSISNTHLLNIQTNEDRQLRECHVEIEQCFTYIRQDGRYLTYMQQSSEEKTLHVIDLITFSDQKIHQFAPYESSTMYPSVFFNWVGNTELLMFTLPGKPFEFEIFNIEQNTAVKTLPLGIPVTSPLFSPDGSRYAYFLREPDTKPRTIEVRKTDNAEIPITMPQVWNNQHASQIRLSGYIHDWHPDNEHLLISNNYLYVENNTVHGISNLQVLNTTDGSVETLIEDDSYSYLNATFNHDGSQILYQRKDTSRGCVYFCNQIMIYDMETGEQTTLPIFGENPQWVNGGKS